MMKVRLRLHRSKKPFCLMYFDPVDKGGLKLELQFSSALTQAVNVTVYAEFNNLMKVNKSCDVIHNFAE